jgi:hypothetical protein
LVHVQVFGQVPLGPFCCLSPPLPLPLPPLLTLPSWVGKTYFTPQSQGVVLNPKASFDLTRSPHHPLPAR